MKKQLTVQNLTKQYGEGETAVTALDAINFTVKQGEFIAIVGPSGCGKSTLLHMLAGVDHPTSGSIVIADTDITTLSSNKVTLFRRKHIGMVYQFYNLIPTLNVIENIELPLKLDRQTIHHEEVEKLLQQFHLENRKNHLPPQLSGGQQQRVAFARAIITKPMLLLADEPTGNLDKKNSEEIIEYIQMIHETTDCTILLVTHNQEIANQADRVIVMEDGKIMRDEVNWSEGAI